MRSTSFAIAALLISTVVYAQEPRQRWPTGSSSSGGSSQGSGETGQRTAVPREEPARQAPPPPAPAPAPAAPAAPAAPRANPPAQATAGDDGQRTAQPRDRRPPQEDTRVAVPRGSAPAPASVVFTPRVYRNTYYYPRRYYPHGYGAFGLGYFYYDPYTWYPYDYGSYRFNGYGYGYPTGQLRLKVKPRDAEVYVDGYYAGRVDDFDGLFQSLELEAGGYSIEIVAPGFQPIEFDVRIQPGRKITYDADLGRPRRP